MKLPESIERTRSEEHVDLEKQVSGVKTSILEKQMIGVETSILEKQVSGVKRAVLKSTLTRSRPLASP